MRKSFTRYFVWFRHGGKYRQEVVVAVFKKRIFHKRIERKKGKIIIILIFRVVKH